MRKPIMISLDGYYSGQNDNAMVLLLSPAASSFITGVVHLVGGGSLVRV